MRPSSGNFAPAERLTPPATAVHPQAPNRSPAHALTPEQRQRLALDALAGTQPISALAQDAHVSRKFVYQQQDLARHALSNAFDPPTDDAVLFHLPVTKHWIRQFTLGLVLIGHCPLRGVVELFRDFFDHDLSLGHVHNIIHSAVERARHHNANCDLSPVRIGAHDEIFQNGQPVLVGVDVGSTFCYLLRLEEHRDADTWGVRLLELQDHGLRPDATIADAGRGLRAGQTLAWPDTPCRGDIFHALRDLGQLIRFLDNRAYGAVDACDQQQRRMTRAKRHGRGKTQSKRLALVRQEQDRAIALADEVSVLLGGLRDDIFTVAGPDHPTRCHLFDFVVAELDARAPRCPHRIGPAVRALRHQRDDLLAFAGALDEQLAAVANEYEVPPALVREVLAVSMSDERCPATWQRDAELHRRLGTRYRSLRNAVAPVAAGTVRASSVIENLNSRLRGYFFLREAPGRCIPGSAAVLPEPPTVRTQRAPGTREPEPDGVADRLRSSALGRTVGIPTVPTQLNTHTRPSQPSTRPRPPTHLLP